MSIQEVNELCIWVLPALLLGQSLKEEKRFDLVVRLDEHHRKGISDMEHLYVDSPLGYKIPLRELATISYTEGPAKISRDNTKRRSGRSH